jgi:hypothetical protein
VAERAGRSECADPLSPGFVIYNEVHAHDEPRRHLMWRALAVAFQYLSNTAWYSIGNTGEPGFE